MLSGVKRDIAALKTYVESSRRPHDSGFRRGIADREIEGHSPTRTAAIDHDAGSVPTPCSARGLRSRPPRPGTR